MEYDDLVGCFKIAPDHPRYDELVDAGLLGYEEGERLCRRCIWEGENPYDDVDAEEEHVMWNLGFEIAKEEAEETQSEYWRLESELDMAGEDFTPSRAAVDIMPLSGLERPLSDAPSLVRCEPKRVPEKEEPTPRFDFDVFISHASEDKDAVARPLSNALRAGGLRVWFDEFELKIGDSLRRKIDAGVARSRFGVIVLSEAFFTKGWTNYELDGIVSKANSGEQVLLPIWHKVEKSQILAFSPSIADKVARSTTTHTVQRIAAEIISVIRRAEQTAAADGEDAAAEP